MAEALPHVHAVRDARRPKPAAWPQVYGRILVASDLLVMTMVMTLAVFAAGLFGASSATRSIAHGPAGVALGIGCVVVWMLMLTISGSRSPRVVGTGVTEYRRVLRSTFVVFGALALVAYVVPVDGLRGFLFVAFPTGVIGLVLSRWMARQWLAAKRRAGEMSHRVVLVGSEKSIAKTASDLRRSPSAGLRVVGACTSSGQVAGEIPGLEGIPVSGSLDRLIEALEVTGADTVVITSANELSADAVRELSWKLEPGRQHLIVAPSLTDIGGPRIHTRPVAGVPLIHVETPRYDGGKLYAKRLFDIVSSGALIILLAPLLVAIAMIVRLSTPGTVLFRQERIGLKGRRFHMLKFRSMYMDAEERLAELEDAERDKGNAVMFKMKDDPRVTPIGKVLRRFSLDELPQLFNVLFGSMSLVGPRPPLPREVEQYSQFVHRRFLVKPGITGLWQVSGRSNLDWDETVRLDLFYVENWTMTGDLVILLKTVRAVVASDGAY
ncbi:sugar transferase [Microbacterium sp. No. 7]|uniref:sugar transferase n=1 Tax=Microbacterium sp. No. 7 TaxID=1714373 RepID=UPI001E3C434C|nr:sugar transferase [Microbacterium sp. No. 7]